MVTAPRKGFLFDGRDPPSKAALLDRALRLFVRDGLCETSIRDIAHASGHTNPALYKFFATKEALALHLFARCYRHIVTKMQRARSAGDFAARVDALLAAFVELCDEDLDALIFVNETLRTFWPQLPPAQRKQSVLGELRLLIEAGKKEGAIPKSVDAALAIALLAGTFTQIARMVYFNELPPPLARHLPSLRALLANALTRPPKR